VKRFLTMVAVASVATGLLAADASAAKVKKQVLYVRLVATSGWNVDNDPSGPSGGDLFGSEGNLVRSGRGQVGTYTSACTASSAERAQCQATLVWKNGKRLQIGGDYELQGSENQLAIVGGTGKYRKARGEAIVRPDTANPTTQKAKLKILL
jgi:dirigent-like protein